MNRGRTMVRERVEACLEKGDAFVEVFASQEELAQALQCLENFTRGPGTGLRLNLRDLDKSVKDERVHALVGSGQHLGELSLSGNLWLSHPFSYLNKPPEMSSLSCLDLSHCIRLTNVGLVSAVTCFPTLRKLSIECCYLVTDSSIKALTDHLVSLEYLSLQGCSQVSDVGIRYLCEKKSTDLVYLNLSGLCDLSCAALIDIPWPKLVGFHCVGCVSLGDAGAFSVLNSAREQLQELSFAGIRHLSDAAFPQHLPALRTLNVEGCYSLSDSILPRLTNLKALKVGACPGITPAALDKLKKNDENIDVQIGIRNPQLDVGLQAGVSPRLLLRVSSILAVLLACFWFEFIPAWLLAGIVGVFGAYLFFALALLILGAGM